MSEPFYLFSRIAFRHDIDEADTLHALRNAIGQWHLDAEPPDRPDVRLLSIGPARNGQLLEVAVIPSHTSHQVIHSMKLRPSTRALFL